MFQGRDSSLGLLIASGIFKRLVPGSPAALYLGGGKLALKLIRAFFDQLCQLLEFLSNFVASEQRGLPAAC